MTRRQMRLLVLGVSAVIMFLPAVSHACPNCYASSSKPVLDAYYLSIAFLILIPFGIVGSMLAWLVFRLRRFQTRASNASSVAETSFT